MGEKTRRLKLIGKEKGMDKKNNVMVIEEDCCGTCHFWRKNQDVKSTDPDADDNDCRYEPPKVFLAMGKSKFGEAQPVGLTICPRPKRDFWCGKHELVKS